MRGMSMQCVMLSDVCVGGRDTGSVDDPCFDRYHHFIIWSHEFHTSVFPSQASQARDAIGTLTAH